MSKILEIKNCVRCEYYEGDFEGDWCKKGNRSLVGIEPFPAWCPLPDSKSEWQPIEQPDLKNFLKLILSYFGLTNKPFKYTTFSEWQPYVPAPYHYIDLWILELMESAFNAGRKTE